MSVEINYRAGNNDPQEGDMTACKMTLITRGRGWTDTYVGMEGSIWNYIRDMPHICMLCVYIYIYPNGKSYDMLMCENK